MDVMYIVGDGSKHDNFELRHSLRSLERYGRNVGRVIVSGVPPAFLSDRVERVDVAPYDGLPGRNRKIILNVVKGVKRSGLRGDFVLGIDDVFLVAPLDLDDMPTYISAQHLPTTVSPGGGGWISAMADTGRWLRENHYRDVNFMNHAHIRMNADTILRHEDELLYIATSGDTVRGLEILSLVGNMALRDGVKINLAMRPDVKLDRFDLTGITDCFSISDRIFDDEAFADYMGREYPEKSIWEAE